jgi:hypothetical protein
MPASQVFDKWKELQQLLWRNDEFAARGFESRCFIHRRKNFLIARDVRQLGALRDIGSRKCFLSNQSWSLRRMELLGDAQALFCCTGHRKDLRV